MKWTRRQRRTSRSTPSQAAIMIHREDPLELGAPSGQKRARAKKQRERERELAHPREGGSPQRHSPASARRLARQRRRRERRREGGREDGAASLGGEGIPRPPPPARWGRAPAPKGPSRLGNLRPGQAGESEGREEWFKSGGSFYKE
jgi:hypothetical protein